MAYTHEFGIIEQIEEGKVYQSKEIEALIHKIDEAEKCDKWLIHYGI